jgi:hypothetical protein
MAKTYILEPGNAVVSDAGRGEYYIRFDDYTNTTYNDMIANKDKSLFMSINDAVGPITAEADETFSVVVNGWTIQALSTESNIYLVYPESEDTEITSGTYTVSIYYESESGSSTGLPDMNIVHEHKETAKNDIEDIIKAIYESIDETEAPTNGHSPMDRLVVAVAKLHEVDTTTALSQGNYPNQMKRIAAVIRGDFNDDESHPK